MTRKKTASGGKGHRFGGDWTDRKLDVLARYLQSYTTALQGKPTPDDPFVKAYIDAFAGTGYRHTPRTEHESSPGQKSLLFPDLADEAPQALLDGSARRALRTEPRFDRYIFIERDQQRCQHLEALKQEFPDLAPKIKVHQEDANLFIQSLCERNWASHRAVLFLDPYGMQVEWSTIEAVAKTKAIDLWVLFPLGIGVNRLLKRSGDIPEGWRKALDRLLGTTEWYEEFYRTERAPTLFDDDQEMVIKASMETIGGYFNSRLAQVFAGVAKSPGVLRNSTNNPLYLLCFAVGNERGKDIALRIANHLLKELR